MAITSIFGVYIRPRKKKIYNKSITLRFVIEGSIPSKKNNQVAIVKWKEADRIAEKIFQSGKQISATEYDKIKRFTKAFITPSARHQKWENKVAPLIIAQRNKWTALIASKGLIWPLSKCSVSIYTYKKDRKLRDMGNRLLSVEDILVKCQVILDDNDKVLAPITLDADEYVDEITEQCTVINLTAYY
jgi:hypothetical protein